MSISTTHKRIRLGLLTVWLLVVGWMSWNMQAHDVPVDVLKSDAAVAVTQTKSSIAFSPQRDTVGVGLLFFPGALVDPVAYAPMARAMARRGIFTVIVKVPLRLAPRKGDERSLFEATLSEIRGDTTRRSWIVGGHSRGGALASLFAKDHADELAGLLLVGTSHPKDYSLRHLQADVTKVYATNDGLASVNEVRGFASNLPGDAHFVQIQGGNHRQFGYYGWQLGDGKATITRSNQIHQTVTAIMMQVDRIRGARVIVNEEDSS